MNHFKIELFSQENNEKSTTYFRKNVQQSKDRALAETKRVKSHNLTSIRSLVGPCVEDFLTCENFLVNLITFLLISLIAHRLMLSV